VGFLDDSFYHNTVREYLVAAGIALAIVLGAQLVRRIITRRLHAMAAHTKTKVDDMLVDLLERTRVWAVFVVALYLGSLSLTLHPDLARVIKLVAVTVFLVQIGLWGTGTVRFTVANYRRSKEEEGDTSSLGTILVLTVVARMVMWVIILLLVLENVGVDVTALVAGLGIGGVAVALALQNILGDLFASVSIMLDKPFEVGDFVVVGEEMGNIENIGVKTTRVRSLSGEQLVFANGDLLKSRIRNFKRMQERRVLFSVGVTYQTPADEVERLPVLLESIVTAVEGIRFDRAHFKGFGDSALIYEIVYWVESPDYKVYMDAQQRINFAIVRAFEDIGVEIAYPTQTLHIQDSKLSPAPPSS